MKQNFVRAGVVVTLTIASLSISAQPGGDERDTEMERGNAAAVQLGPRPYFLINNMEESRLKRELQKCAGKPVRKSDFSIGHRGAAMQFPEHTEESYVAAARMGAGIVECDVTFTQDRELVCRHSQCDLHTTTNIVATDLARKCSVPPVVEDGVLMNAADIQCCTSDITLAEFKTLKGKMDGANKGASSLDEYLAGTAEWRTDLYDGSATLMTHAESIELFKQLRVKMTPELKSPSVEMPYEGDYTQQDYAQQIIDEYRAAGVKPRHVFLQSFNLDDVLYWINNEPAFGQQAVYLDGRYDQFPNLQDYPDGLSPSMNELVELGVNYIAPPMWALLTTEGDEMVPSAYARAAREAGLKIITWTLERSDLRAGATESTWYHQTTHTLVDRAGDKMITLDVLAREVGIEGIFADWPAPVTYYANCMKQR